MTRLQIIITVVFGAFAAIPFAYWLAHSQKSAGALSKFENVQVFKEDGSSQCSKDGMHWFRPRSDGACYWADAPSSASPPS